MSPAAAVQGFMPITQFDKPPKIGDEVEFNVEGYDAANGVLKLTREGVAQYVDWSSVQIGQTVEARVTGTNKGGLSVEVNGIRGFLPISQIDIYRVENVEQFVNQRLLCLVAEVDPAETEPRRQPQGAARTRARKAAREVLGRGRGRADPQGDRARRSSRSGRSSISAGPMACLPVSELSWGRVGTPSEVVSHRSAGRGQGEARSTELPASCRSA